MTNPTAAGVRCLPRGKASADAAPGALVLATTPTPTDKANKMCVSAEPGPSAPMVKAEVDANPSRKIGGSWVTEFNSVILHETLGTIRIPGGEHDGQDQRTRAVMAALMAFKPKDEIEGMLAAQTTALHFGAMECFRRAMIPDQPFDIASKLRRDGANLARGMTEMLDAIARKRGKGPQVVRVERVVVQDGGQAIVGAVSAGTGVPGRGEG